MSNWKTKLDKIVKSPSGKFIVQEIVKNAIDRLLDWVIEIYFKEESQDSPDEEPSS